MSSSISPPTGSKQKFGFDLDFEVEEERMRLEMLRQEELLRQKQSMPAMIYSESDLEAAKAEAFQRGQAHGLDDAKKSLEKTIADLAERTLQSVHVMLQHEQEREVKAQETALRTAMAVIKKFWPVVLQTTGVEALEKTLRETIANNPDETRIVLRVHDSLLDSVIQRLPQIKEQEAFHGKIIVVADETVMPGDSKIEWADGGMESLGRTLTQKLDEAVERLIATLKHTNHATSTTERMSS